MREEKKAKALRSFKDGHTKILVSTIIAEVGLDNSNATVMVIEGADRFGLSQLHQLRGRVCRSTDTAFCFLVAETANQTSIDRLEVIEKCMNGFEISEHDLRLRGPGDMFGTDQHGLPPLKHASLVTDYDLILEARKMVQDRSIGEGTKEFAQMRYDLGLGEVT
jgi:ATP-dependent DNA helicase RecG